MSSHRLVRQQLMTSQMASILNTISLTGDRNLHNKITLALAEPVQTVFKKTDACPASHHRKYRPHMLVGEDKNMPLSVRCIKTNVMLPGPCLCRFVRGHLIVSDKVYGSTMGSMKFIIKATELYNPYEQRWPSLSCALPLADWSS